MTLSERWLVVIGFVMLTRFLATAAVAGRSRRMLTNFYAVRHWLISLRLASGRELEGPIELLVVWPERRGDLEMESLVGRASPRSPPT